MAERSAQTDDRRRTHHDGQGERRRERGDGPRRVNALGAARRAGEALQALLHRSVEGVVEVTRDQDGGWVVAVEVLEMTRVPTTSDVLGVYEVELDAYGALQGYRRRSRYVRGSTDSD